jgi:hypothetical protein
MPQFRNKPRIIDAERFLDPANPPKGIERDDTAYHGPGFYVTTIQGERVRVHPGEWIVDEDGAAGRFYPILDAGGVPKEYEPL